MNIIQHILMPYTFIWIRERMDSDLYEQLIPIGVERKQIAVLLPQFE